MWTTAVLLVPAAELEVVWFAVNLCRASAAAILQLALLRRESDERWGGGVVVRGGESGGVLRSTKGELYL
jgi:hypothetical protein